MITPTDQSAGALQLKGAVADLSDTLDWKRVFSQFSHIVLVANSGLNDVQLLQRHYPASTLFVFFNKVYKTLSEDFKGNAILVSRGQPAGANIVYKGEVDEVLAFFEQATFLGILNLRLSVLEKLNTSADFHGAPTGHLDLVGFTDRFYTPGKTPTSGFAMAMWLTGMNLPGSIVLAGFSARRTEKWRVVAAHDWSFEQTCFRLLARADKISIHDGVAINAYENLSDLFPEISKTDIALAAAEVFSERLGNTDAEVDKLITLTGAARKIDQMFRSLRPAWMKKKKPHFPGPKAE
ncbi:3-deoxy-manno-octulosonate cytidylyltransferase [Rhizobium mongolense]|uniref:3-deoxy-manno-octulosonate cytidylyltransferase n=1 Tax=Rhizobium mongolense TaxID=57676 RepID=UPI003F5EA384